MQISDIQYIQDFASQCRRDVLRMVHAVSSGHPGGSLGCADLFACLYNGILSHNPKFNMNGEHEDLFFLSNGHIAPIWYATLARSGYFPVEELATLRKLNTRLQGHPTTEEGLPGIRVASGSLGQGLSVAIGAALTKKLNNDNKFVYVLMGDGELQEGQIWEAAMFASHHKINNLIGIVDYNGRQIDGDVENVMSLGNLKLKWQSFGWNVLEMDGHDIENIFHTIENANKLSFEEKPIVVLMKTEMGNGVDFMMGTHKWHGSAPNDEQLEKALLQLTETLGDY